MIEAEWLGWKEDSPWQPLVRRLALFFALMNAAIVPAFSAWNMIVFSGIVTGDFRQFLALPLLAVAVAGIILIPVQIVFWTVCLTWGVGKFWQRLLIHWLLVAAGGVCLAIGFLLFQLFAFLFAGEFGGPATRQNWYLLDAIGWGDVGVAFVVIGSTPLYFYGMQLPFWAFRVLGGWRLRKSNFTVPVAQRGEALSIFDLLLVTTFLGVCLALVQFAAPRSDAVRIIFEAFGGVIFYGSLSLLFAVPQAFLFLSKVRLTTAWGVSLAVPGLCSLLLSLVILVLSRDILLTGFYLGSLLFGASVYVAGTGYGFTLLRRDGWQLIGRRPAAAAPRTIDERLV